MYTTHLAHEAALFLMHGGPHSADSSFAGRVDRLRARRREIQNLWKAYVVLDDPKGPPINFIQNWQTGWLPAVYQVSRVRFRRSSPILNLAAKQNCPRARSSISAAACFIAWTPRIAIGTRATSSSKRASPTPTRRALCKSKPPTRSVIDKESEATKEAYGT